MNTRTIGLELGVAATSELAVAEGTREESTRRVASTPAGLVTALGDAAAGQPVNIVLEATAMAWFVAAERVPLGQVPSLHHLRSRSSGVVR